MAASCSGGRQERGVDAGSLRGRRGLAGIEERVGGGLRELERPSKLILLKLRGDLLRDELVEWYVEDGTCELGDSDMLGREQIRVIDIEEDLFKEQGLLIE